MARRFTPVLRIWIFVAAFAQALSPGIVSVVDATAAAASASASIQPHAESHGTPRCPRVHQEDKCALCQFVSGAVAVSGDAGPSPVAASNGHQVIPGRTLAPECLADGTPSLPRAPPQIA